jgi:hypothetical protein
MPKRARPEQPSLPLSRSSVPAKRSSGCAPGEYRVNLTPGSRPVQACVRDVAQASSVVRQRFREVGSMTLWFTGYQLGDPRADEVGPWAPHERPGAVIDGSGKVIAQVDVSGDVYGPDGSRAGAKPLYEPPRPPPKPPDPLMQWIGWYNSAPLGTPMPPVDPATKARIEHTFGLDKCQRIARALASGTLPPGNRDDR